MGGVYTAPALLGSSYSLVIPNRSLLLSLSFLNNTPHALSAKHPQLDEPRCISILLYIYLHNGDAHTMVTLYRRSIGS